MKLTRRSLLKLGLGAVPATLLCGRNSLVAQSASSVSSENRPNSMINGVQIGIIAPYSTRGANSAEEILQFIVDAGIGAVELQNNPVEAFAGSPAGGGRRGGRGRGRGGQNDGPSPVSEWRSAVSMERFVALRKMFNDAGVSIYAFKLGLGLDTPDAECDYAFNVCKALGASHLTMELPGDPAATEKIGAFAAKHEIYAAYHNHTQVNEQSWDTALAQSPYNALNLDVGHFTAAIKANPIPFVEKHADRIKSMHFKDRTYDQGNLPWGQGQTPLREILQLMKRNRYTFPATIEKEYPTPEGSSELAEIRKCYQFAREALS